MRIVLSIFIVAILVTQVGDALADTAYGKPSRLEAIGFDVIRSIEMCQAEAFILHHSLNQRARGKSYNEVLRDADKIAGNLDQHVEMVRQAFLIPSTHLREEVLKTYEHQYKQKCYLDVINHVITFKDQATYQHFN